MKKNLGFSKTFGILSVLALIWVIFYCLIFILCANISVDSVIALSLLVFFFFSYKYLSDFLYNYFWNISKSIAIYYVSLFNFMILLKRTILSLNRSFLTFLKYQVIVISVSMHEVKTYWMDLNSILMKKFFINNALKILFKQLSSFRNRKILVKSRTQSFLLIFGFKGKISSCLYNNYQRSLYTIIILKLLSKK